jgi:relaxase/mobilization nuclease domain protein
MIATILRSSTRFNAVEYNEKKVTQGTAKLLEIKNFDLLQKTGNVNSTSLQDYLIKYSSKNDNIQKPQFHLAISCKKDEYDYDELIEFAHKYLKKMGYGEEGQPLLIYGHYDTNNHHIHIVTSRIDPQGKKIEHDNERLRSQAVINKLMGLNPQNEVKKAIQESFAYSFDTLGQFQAILESCGYESFNDADMISIKKGGVVLDTIHLDEISKHFKVSNKEKSEKRRKQLKAIFLKYKKITSNKEELDRILQKKFGVNLIFIGKKDSPYGYLIVDHKEKAVYKGGDVLSLKELLTYPQKKQVIDNNNKEAILKTLNSLLEVNNKSTMREVNKSLWQKFGVNIYSDGVIRDKRKRVIAQADQRILDTLNYNAKVHWIKGFNPSTMQERAILCQFGHIDNEEDIEIAPETNREKINALINDIKEIVGTSEKDELYSNLKAAKIIIIRKEQELYALDLGISTIVNLQETDIVLSKFKSINKGHDRSNLNQVNISGQWGKILSSTSSAHHSNREWEVGGNSDWEYVDNELKHKR